MTPLSVEAPAKLNRTLRVTGRRADGYHELDSEFLLLELADRLLLMPGCSGFRVDGRAHELPVGPDNLAWRGLLAGTDGPPELACLTLEKRIPVAAGLAGGSSDAAAAWRLGRAWNGEDTVPGPDDLAALARIGADVPFFAAQVARAHVTGIGERIGPLPPTSEEVVLVHPPFGLPTAAVFAELRADEWGTATNDLLAPARRLRPELDELVAAVRAAGAEPQLTGSGPTLFVMTDDPERADALAAGMQAKGVATTRTRTRTAAAPIERLVEDEDEKEETAR